MNCLISDRDGDERLHLGLVTGSVTLPNFDALMMGVLGLRGRPGTPKMAHPGFIASRFRPHWRRDEPTWGIRMWRNTVGEIDEITALVVDVDNDKGGAKATWADVAAVGVEAFGYDSFSARADQPRFRAVIEIDRSVNRVELRALMAVINKHVFGGQLDMSMADRAHYAIAPDHRAAEYYSFGPALAVDDWLARGTAEAAAGCPYLAVAAVARSLRSVPHACLVAPHGAVARPVGSPQAASAHPSDPAVIGWVSEADITEYGDAVSGHWQGLFRVLRRVVRRAGGVLTHADLAVIADHVDSHADYYFSRKYGADGLVQRISDAMNVETKETIFRKQRR
jgi:hypothetical protein